MGQKLDTLNLCTQYNPLSSDNNMAGQHAHELPHTKEEWEVLLNIETTPITRTS